MFSGIIESLGRVDDIRKSGTNVSFYIHSSLAPELKVDQSIAHNGVCLTVEEISGDRYRVTAVEETLQKTELRSWKVDQVINLERCMKLGDRLDGHIVQGHADTVGQCVGKEDREGSWRFRFRFPDEYAPLLVNKGSIAVNGISLTAFDCMQDQFSVAIIPYTYIHTNLHTIEPGSAVNLEFDILGKYILRWADSYKSLLK